MKRIQLVIAAAVIVMMAAAGIWWSTTGPSADSADAGHPAVDAARLAADAATSSPAADRPRLIEVKVYFMNSRLDPEVACEKVFPVVRNIPGTQAVPQAVLTELLSGPTTAERADGFATTINNGVSIQFLVIKDGVAKVDFSRRLEEFVGGSCRVVAIRSQITATLKQFPMVTEVIISIDGRTEDILQP